jgi:hypothetical protein
MSTKFNDKPTIRIKSKVIPYDNGLCRTCYHNHRSIIVELENGGHIYTVPAYTKLGFKDRSREDSSNSSLADLFWPPDANDTADTQIRRRDIEDV